MNCLKAEEQFSAYFEDELDYQAVRAFESHLSNCQPCRQEFARFRGSLDLLHQLPQIEPSAKFDIAVRARLANTLVESIPFWRRVLRPLHGQPAWALSGIAALLVMFAGIYLYRSTIVKSPPFDVAIAPESSRHVRLSGGRSDKQWRQEFPLAVPSQGLQFRVNFPEFPAFDPQPVRRGQQPQRIEQNYILQTINYTEAPTSGGL